MKQLKLADSLAIPLEVLTETVAVIAKRRMGKSYFARKLAEQLFQAGQQVVIADPKGDHWGIRSGADGRTPGLPIIVLGGERGDAPLEASAGEVVAKLVVEERVSALLDLSLFRKHEVATFMTAFLETLYRMKARERYRTPMMLIIDEADAIAPQRPMKGEERMLGAAEDIVRRGGQRGIGCTLVTQRTAVLNKNVLTQAQILVALRTIAPQDLAAMDAWIDVHGTREEREMLMESLPSLPRGEAWVWSPGWPTSKGIFERVAILPIETFDSGATPAAGEKRREPKKIADIDIEALKRQMAATLERAKENDPSELKRRIAQLERELKSKPTPATDEKSLARAKTDAQRDARTEWEPLLKQRDTTIRELHGKLSRIAGVVEKELGKELPKLLELPNAPVAAPRAPAVVVERAAAPRINRATQQPVAADGLTPAKQKILNGLAFLAGIGVPSADKTQLALIVGVSPTSGGYFNNLGALRSAGLIEYPSGGAVALTEEGERVASTEGVPSTTVELHDAIRAKLPPAKWRILKELIGAYPKAIGKDDLATRIGVSPTSGGYFNNLGSLRSLGLLDYPQKGFVAAQPVLFLERG